MYSGPWRLIGQQVTARTAGDVVQIFHADTVVATHVLHLSGRSTNFEHYPPHKIAHTLRSVTWCRTQAEQIGPSAVAIVAELSQVNAIHRLRAIQGIIRLRDTYGAPLLKQPAPEHYTSGTQLPHRQGHPARRHRTRQRPTRRPLPDTAGDATRTRRLRHRTNRLITTAPPRSPSEHVLLQPHPN